MEGRNSGRACLRSCDLFVFDPSPHTSIDSMFVKHHQDRQDGWPVGQLAGRQASRLTDRLAGWQAGCVAVTRLPGRMVGRPAGQPEDRLAAGRRPAGGPVGWLEGRRMPADQKESTTLTTGFVRVVNVVVNVVVNLVLFFCFFSVFFLFFFCFFSVFFAFPGFYTTSDCRPGKPQKSIFFFKLDGAYSKLLKKKAEKKQKKSRKKAEK